MISSSLATCTHLISFSSKCVLAVRKSRSVLDNPNGFGFLTICHGRGGRLGSGVRRPPFFRTGRSPSSLSRPSLQVLSRVRIIIGNAFLPPLFFSLVVARVGPPCWSCRVELEEVEVRKRRRERERRRKGRDKGRYYSFVLDPGERGGKRKRRREEERGGGGGGGRRTSKAFVRSFL